MKEWPISQSKLTQEPQYQVLLDRATAEGLPTLGLMSGDTWRRDPRRLTFVLSRYKFVSRLVEGHGRVLEVGCGDGFVSTMVAPYVGELVCTDFDATFIRSAQTINEPVPNVTYAVHDMLTGAMSSRFDAVYALDVLEHIQPTHEGRFLRNIADSTVEHGFAVIGMPSLESQAYASEASRVGHVNCKRAPDLQASLKRYFRNVFIFSMNDEVVHTGYYPMAHYLLALAVDPIR